MRRMLLPVCLLAMLISAMLVAPAARAQPAAEQVWPAQPFRLAWQRTDSLVAAGAANYSWFWGPEPRSAPLLERDDQAPGGYRLVQYYDKGRMELPLPAAAVQSTDQLTYGRLVAEMVSGNIQLGAQRFESGAPALIPVVGDRNDPVAPTYAAFARVTSASAPQATGSRPDQSIDRSGSVTNRPDLSAAHPETVYTAYDGALGHNVPRVFSAFMQRTGRINTPQGQQVAQIVDPLQVFGHPISEAYWVDATVGGRVQPVLVQLFERRVLSYNPANPAASQVELGNAGIHYYEWRYGGVQPRSDRREDVFSHFENGEQALTGGYWFSFDDRGSGGTSTASNQLITPGVDGSVQAMRFNYNVTTAIPFSLASLSVGMGANNGTADLRNVNAIGFWARGSGNSISVQLNSALSDDPFTTTFLPSGDWTYVELPLAAMRQSDGQRLADLPQAQAMATRLSFRPADKPSAGYLDIDNVVFISGKTEMTATQPGLPLISNFEDGRLSTTLNTDWFTYTDQDQGGGSTAELASVSPGAYGSKAALRFRGSFNKKWAKTAFLGMGAPLMQNGQPLDLTDYSGIQIAVKTDGQPYRLQFTSKLITDNNQYGITLLGPANEWTTLTIPFSLLTPMHKKDAIPMQVALTQIQNIIITPLNQPQAFQLSVDDVRLMK